VLTLVERIEQNPEKLDDIMIKYHHENLDFSEKYLIDRYPATLGPLKDKFDAYRNIKYNLSIPVFISQPDGILSEITKPSRL
jgi:hypothetical protein